MDLNVNILSSSGIGSNERSPDGVSKGPLGRPVLNCPRCGVEVSATQSNTDSQSCPSCDERLLIRLWPTVRQDNNASVALSDHATCFFHPDKAVKACCRRCGRFVCALCDLELGADHVCPACFERGRVDADGQKGEAEWRYRDVLYDTIAVTVGWGWILFWPTWIVALPAAIFLHVKYRKAPRSYLVPRAGWRFWMAYAGLCWVPIFIGLIFVSSRLGRH